MTFNYNLFRKYLIKMVFNYWLFIILLFANYGFVFIKATPVANYQAPLAMNGLVANPPAYGQYSKLNSWKNVNGNHGEQFQHPLQNFGVSPKDIPPELWHSVDGNRRKGYKNDKKGKNHLLQVKRLKNVSVSKKNTQKIRRELAIVSTNRISGIHGLNWADPRDNYANDKIVLSGLSDKFDYNQTKEMSTKILQQFQQIGANTIRLPVNPPTALTSWWDSYQGAIDAALENGMTVMIGYWEGPDLMKNGRIDDMAKWEEMWQEVIGKYGSKESILFEPMNEPFGYTRDEWIQICINFLETHKNVPRKRIIISGTGFNDNVAAMGAIKELDGTLLSQHFYEFWRPEPKPITVAEWEAALDTAIGPYAFRTIIDEAGCPMTNEFNYGNGDGNAMTAYFAATVKFAREKKTAGLVYWPGYRENDIYSMLRPDDQGNLVVNNESGLKRLKEGWVNARDTGVTLLQNSAAKLRSKIPSKQQLANVAFACAVYLICT